MQGYMYILAKTPLPLGGGGRELLKKKKTSKNLEGGVGERRNKGRGKREEKRK